jgi:hypothetical protein
VSLRPATVLAADLGDDDHDHHLISSEHTLEVVMLKQGSVGAIGPVSA